MSRPEFAAAEFSPADRELLDRASALVAANAPAPADLDLATAMEFVRISRAAPNAEFARAVAAAGTHSPRAGLKIGIVPGAFHREHKDTGAEGAVVRRILASLGYQTELIPVDSFGSLADNARTISEWVERQAPAPVILVSLSKGASDVRTALPRLSAPGRCRIAAWISLSGICTGTPLVDWLRRRPWRWWGVWLLLRWRGQRIDVLKELRHGPDAPLGQWSSLPSGLQVVHIHGFPLRRHLNHRWAAKAYARLAPLGPNDGGSVLLADVSRWPGIVVPLWGVDHYMQPRHDITSQLSRVFQVVVERCA
ncbi:MAG TPA: hypothetical protein VG734_08775 [Lacunisphaera sp.]|nr:hypothetical protein [Lacunisphaera sp.]